MKYQNILQNGKVQCTICPRNCTLAEGQEGFCHVRKNAYICIVKYSVEKCSFSIGIIDTEIVEH